MMAMRLYNVVRLSYPRTETGGVRRQHQTQTDLCLLLSPAAAAASIAGDSYVQKPQMIAIRLRANAPLSLFRAHRTPSASLQVVWITSRTRGHAAQSSVFDLNYAQTNYQLFTRKRKFEMHFGLWSIGAAVG
jgi:hypothetical protein